MRTPLSAPTSSHLSRAERPDPRAFRSLTRGAAGRLCGIAALCLAFAACSPDAGGPDADGAGATDAGATDAGATDTGYFMADVSSPDAAPWPDATDTSMPSCTPWSDAWVLPDVAVPEAPVTLEPSAALQPLGELETVEVTALTADKKRDDTAEGALKVSADADVEVVSAEDMKAGRANVQVRVKTAGAHTLTVTLPDGRTGQARLWGFATQLPVWTLTVDPADLAEVVANPLERIWAKVSLTRGGKTFQGKMRLHGGSSRTFKKKSFRLNLDDDAALPDGRRKVILRAEFADKALVRNHLAYDLLRHATWLPACETTYVHLRINGRFYGVMVHTERVDKDYLSARGLNPKGSLYEADPPFAMSVPGGNLTPVEDPQDYRLLYQRHAGELAYADLIELIEVVLQLPDAEFEAHVDRIIKVDDVLVFLAFNAVIQNQDFVKKNYYLYRDPTVADSRWTVLPWDLDLSLGHLWTEEGDVLDEQIFHDGDPYVGRNVGHSFYNQLVERVLGVPRLRKRFRSFVQHLVDGRFHPDFLSPRIDRALCRMQPDLLADQKKRAKNEEVPQRVQEVKDFVTARRVWLTTWLKEPDE